MKILQETKKVFKREFFTIALTQLALFFSSLLFFVYMRNKLAEYIQVIQGFQLDVNQALSTLDAVDPSSVAQSTAVVDAINSVASETLFFLIIIAPIILFLFWVIFQGIFWRAIKKEKIKDTRSYFLKFAFPTALIFLIATSIIRDPENIPGMFISMFLALYALTIYYAVLSNKKFHHTMHQTINLAIKKFYKYIPLFIPLFILSLLILAVFAMILIHKIVPYEYFNVVLLIAGSIVTLLVSGFYKVIFQKVVEKDLS
tara:strand:- start:8346 stop:9119 length:774 start_codon:yes stop_codon:yes gene_type:complete